MDTQTIESIAALIAFGFIYVCLYYGSEITQDLAKSNWEDILIVMGAVLSILMEVIPLFPNVPAWLPALLTIAIKALKDLQTGTIQSMKPKR